MPLTREWLARQWDGESEDAIMLERELEALEDARRELDGHRLQVFAEPGEGGRFWRWNR
jgi:hypothetical protein